jgi:O-antigen/teichoic acid export membrane protein
MLSGRMDLVIVGMFVGVPMVVYYAIPRSILEYTYLAIRSLTGAFTAPLTHLHAGHDKQETIKLYLKGARLCGLCSFLMTAYIAAFGKSFLVVWQGTAFITGSRSDLVLTILVAAFLPRMLQSISMEFFYATRRLGFLLGIHGLEAGLKVGLCFLLARPYGLIGIAIANLIPSLLFQGLAIPLFLFRDFSFPPREYFREALLRPLAVGACAYLAGMGLVAWHAPWTWPFFLAEALLASVVGAAAAAWIGLQREELRRAVALIPGLRLG